MKSARKSSNKFEHRLKRCHYVCEIRSARPAHRIYLGIKRRQYLSVFYCVEDAKTSVLDIILVTHVLSNKSANISLSTLRMRA